MYLEKLKFCKIIPWKHNWNCTIGLTLGGGRLTLHSNNTNNSECLYEPNAIYSKAICSKLTDILLIHGYLLHLGMESIYTCSQKIHTLKGRYSGSKNHCNVCHFSLVELIAPWKQTLKSIKKFKNVYQYPL